MLRVRSFAAGGAPSSDTRAKLTGLGSLDTSVPKHQSKLATDCGAAHDIVVVAASTKPSSNTAPAKGSSRDLAHSIFFLDCAVASTEFCSHRADGKSCTAC